jgi:two-component system NtrC family sensor kinase
MPSEIRDNEELYKLDLVTVNERLMLALVRQHELTEEAEQLNASLQAESLARKKAEEALVKAEKLASVGRMAAVLAHEINNPLEAVTNILFLAQSTDGMPDVARQYLAMADSELKRVAHITRQTLGFYRESTSPVTFYVSSLIDSVIEVLQAKSVSKRAIVTKRCADPLEITAFQGELRQVLANLLMNSLDAIADQGRVTIRGLFSRSPVTKQPRIRITVSDDGQGMSPTVLRQVFEPFFTTKGSVGNGLGLWVSKQLIEKHHGSIQVRSCTKGASHGTTFSIVLPVQ